MFATSSIVCVLLFVLTLPIAQLIYAERIHDDNNQNIMRSKDRRLEESHHHVHHHSFNHTAQPVYMFDWFSTNIPSWQYLVRTFGNQSNVKCLEVGSFEGRSARYTASNICNGDGSTLTCVDTFQGSVEHEESFRKNLFDRFQHNVREFIDEGRLTAIRKPSREVFLQMLVENLADPTKHRFDFIYVDGSHTAKDVLMDGVLAWDLLKVGGYLAFDDYLWKEQYGLSMTDKAFYPQTAVNAFMDAYVGCFEVVYKGYQVHLKKIKEKVY